MSLLGQCAQGQREVEAKGTRRGSPGKIPSPTVLSPMGGGEVCLRWIALGCRGGSPSLVTALPFPATALRLLPLKPLMLTAEGGDGCGGSAPGADVCPACWPTDPVVEVVSAMQDLAVEEGGSAELLCQYSRPVQATWKMDEREVRTDGHRVIIEQDWNVARLTFRPALPCDSGIYSCEAAGTRVVALLQVQGEAAWWAAPGPGQLWHSFGCAVIVEWQAVSGGSGTQVARTGGNRPHRWQARYTRS